MGEAPVPRRGEDGPTALAYLLCILAIVPFASWTPLPWVLATPLIVAMVWIAPRCGRLARAGMMVTGTFLGFVIGGLTGYLLSGTDVVERTFGSIGAAAVFVAFVLRGRSKEARS